MPSEQSKALGRDIIAALEQDMFSQFSSEDIIRYLNTFVDRDSRGYIDRCDSETVSAYRELLQELHLCILFIFSFIDGDPVSEFITMYSEFDLHFEVARSLIKIKAKITKDQNLVLYLNTQDAFYQQQIITRYISDQHFSITLKEIFEVTPQGHLVYPDLDSLHDFLSEAGRFIKTLKELVAKIDTHVFINDIDIIDHTAKKADIAAVEFYDSYIDDHHIKSLINNEYLYSTVKDKLRVEDPDVNQIMIEIFTELQLGLLFVAKLFQDIYPHYHKDLEHEEKIPAKLFKVLLKENDVNYLPQKEIIDCYFEPKLIAEKKKKIDLLIKDDKDSEASRLMIYTFVDLKAQVDCVNYILKKLTDKQPIYQDDETLIAETERRCEIDKQLGIEGGVAQLLAVMATAYARDNAESSSIPKLIPGKNIYDEQIKRCKEKFTELMHKKDEFYRYYNRIKKTNLIKGNEGISAKFNINIVNCINDFTIKDRFFQTAVFNVTNQGALVNYEADLDKMPAKLRPFMEIVGGLSKALTEEKPLVQATTPNSGNKRKWKKLRNETIQLPKTLQRTVSDSALDEAKNQIIPPALPIKLNESHRNNLLMLLPDPSFKLDLRVAIPDDTEVAEIKDEVMKMVKQSLLTKREKKAIKKQIRAELEQKVEQEKPAQEEILQHQQQEQQEQQAQEVKLQGKTQEQPSLQREQPVSKEKSPDKNAGSEQKEIIQPGSSTLSSHFKPAMSERDLFFAAGINDPEISFPVAMTSATRLSKCVGSHLTLFHRNQLFNGPLLFQPRTDAIGLGDSKLSDNNFKRK